MRLAPLDWASEWKGGKIQPDCGTGQGGSFSIRNQNRGKKPNSFSCGPIDEGPSLQTGASCFHELATSGLWVVGHHVVGDKSIVDSRRNIVGKLGNWTSVECKAGPSSMFQPYHLCWMMGSIRN